MGMGINNMNLVASSQGAMASAMANPAAAPTPVAAPTPAAASASTPAPAPTSAQQTLTNFNNQQAAGGTPRQRKPKTTADAEEEDNHLTPSDAPKGTEEAAVKALSSIQIGSGLAIAFFTLIALMWLLVPTGSGYTRAQLLWFTLWGNTKLTTDKSLQSSGPSPEQVAEAPQPQPLVQTVPAQQNGSQSQLLANIDFSALDTYNAF